MFFFIFIYLHLLLFFFNTKRLNSSNWSYIFANFLTVCFVTAVFIFFAIVQQPRAKHSNIWDQNNIINMSSLSLGEKKIIQQHLAAFIYYTSSADTSTIKMSAFLKHQHFWCLLNWSSKFFLDLFLPPFLGILKDDSD